MKVLLLSNSFTTKDSLESLFRTIFRNVSVVKSSTLKEYSISQLITYDFIFIEVDGYSYQEINLVYQIKTMATDLKVMILDRSKSRDNFKVAVDNSIEGYISTLNDRDEFIHNLHKVLNGKKVYDSELIQSMINTNNIEGMDTLTRREREVLEKIGKGLNNKSIARCLYITEYTVKKHVSNIFSKLNLNSRQEAIIYVNQF